MARYGTSVWSAAAVVLAGLSWLFATVAGARSWTLAFSSLGLAVTVLGAAAVWKKQALRDQTWLALAGALCGVLLVMTVFAPAFVNAQWVLDVPVAPIDADAIVVVSRKNVTAAGKPQAELGWAEAVTEAIRQDDVLVRINYLEKGKLSEKGTKEFLLLHLRLSNCGHGDKFAFAGFAKGKHEPLLTDLSGNSMAFVEQRNRLLKAEPGLVFVAAEPMTVSIAPGRGLDYQLVFEAPLEGFSVLTIELPAVAWGRKGVCKVRVPGIFHTSLPEFQEK